MSETWKETVNVDYTYDCPTDNYLDGKKTAKVTENYNGPARLVALVDKESKTVEVTLREWEAYDGRPDRANCDNVVIDCSKDALVCEVLSDYHNNHLDDNSKEVQNKVESRTEKTISTPDGYGEFSWMYPIHPDELYNSNRTTYVDGKWNLHKNTNAEQIGEADWTTIRTLRNEILQNTDGLIGGDVPQDMQDEVAVMRQKLRDLPAELANIDPVFVPSSFPSTKILEKN